MNQRKNNLQDAVRIGNWAKNPMRLVLKSWQRQPVGRPISRPQAGPRIKSVKIYYSARNHGEYLRQLIDSSGMGIVVQTDHLKHLSAPGAGGVDLVILEYQKNNSKLDRWIEESTANPQGPVICLYLHKFSLVKLWQAMHLGVKECLFFPVQAEQLQAAVDRLEAWSIALTGRGDSRIKNKSPAHTTLERVNGIAV